MSVATFEGVIEHGQIKLAGNVQLPENTRVYILVPGIQIEEIAHLRSPRLAKPEQAADFVLGITEEPEHAGVQWGFIG